MPKFPKTEAERIALAQQIGNGLNTNPNLSGSPVTKSEFDALLTAFLAKRDQILVKEASLGEDYDQKEDLLDDLTDAMKRIIAYVEVVSDSDPSELATIGWAVSNSLAAKENPGQPRALEIISQTDGNIFLDWKNPSGGGRVASYRAERRERPSGAWEACGATNVTEILLLNQPRGKEMEFRIVAFNTNGDSTPSNTVAAVL